MRYATATAAATSTASCSGAVATAADVPLVREMYRGFDIHAVEARRNVNSNAGKRGKVGEVIIV